MINIRAITANVQRLENKAADKIGMRIAIMSDAELFGKNGAGYIEKTVELMAKDIFPEMKAAIEEGAKLGQGLRALNAKKG